MRTSNCKCVICEKPLYRRPNEIKKYNFVCCQECRSEAYRRFPNNNSLNNLELGREKGTNHLHGIPKSKSSNEKRSKTNKFFWKNNPIKLKERGAKTKGENHYNWKGGKTNLNQSIRSLNEMRKWQNAVKKRDKKCVACGSEKELEAHHIISVNNLIEKHLIQTREQAVECNEFWELDNGITLCRKCHYELEGRTYDNNK